MRILALAALFGALAALPVAADTTAPPEARSVFDRAEIAREEGHLEEAAKLYRQAIDAYPVYIAAHARYVAVLRALGDTGPGRGLYATLAPKYPDLIDLQAFQAVCLPKGKDRAALETLAKDYPGNAQVFLELGRVQLRDGDLTKAEKTCKKLIKLHSDDLRAQVLLGDVYFTRKKYSRARKAYEQAREMESAYIPAVLRWALCRHREGKSTDALAALGRLVAEDNLPRLVAGWWLLAMIRTDLEKYDDALKSMDKVLEIDLDDLSALLAKGQILLRQGKPAEAVKVFEIAAEKHPDSSDASYCVGWAYEKAADAPEIQDAQRKERLVKAAAAYEKCASLDPGPAPRDSLGFAYLLGERHQDAVTQFKRARDIDPKFAPALNNLGLALDLGDNRSEAKKRYQEVLAKIDKNNVRARVMLALDLWLDGAGTKAVKELEKALKIDPKDDLAWTFLGDIQVDNGKFERALKAYKKAVAINDANFTAWFHMGILYDEDKRRYEDADRCYEKAFDLRADPPLELMLRLGGINDVDLLDRPEQALKYYQEYVKAGGKEDWVPDRIDALKELVAK